MAFPLKAYDDCVAALRAVVADRDTKGRNETNDFYSQFPHGNQDLTFELKRRVERILGAEKISDFETVYGDTLDLANYAIFSMMLLKKQGLVSPGTVKSPVSPPPRKSTGWDSVLGYIPPVSAASPDPSLSLDGPSESEPHCIPPEIAPFLSRGT
jgi:hypothetical protein